MTSPNQHNPHFLILTMEKVTNLFHLELITFNLSLTPRLRGTAWQKVWLNLDEHLLHALWWEPILPTSNTQLLDFLSNLKHPTSRFPFQDVPLELVQRKTKRQHLSSNNMSRAECHILLSCLIFFYNAYSHMQGISHNNELSIGTCLYHVSLWIWHLIETFNAMYTSS